MSEFDFESAYTVSGWRGIAWRAIEHPKVQEECQGHPDDGELNGPVGETFYCDGSCEEPYEDTTQVICHMVGDDRKYTFDIDELTKISEDDYCPECGQIGCKAYG